MQTCPIIRKPWWFNMFYLNVPLAKELMAAALTESLVGHEATEFRDESAVIHLGPEELPRGPNLRRSGRRSLLDDRPWAVGIFLLVASLLFAVAALGTEAGISTIPRRL